MKAAATPFIEQIYQETSKKNRGVVFLDRDDTIIRDPNYLRSTDQVSILPGVIEGLRLLQQHDFFLIVITNQAAVARGYITIPELKEINDYIVSLFVKEAITINAVYSCPHHPNADLNEYQTACLCRKPNIAMLERAVEVFSPDLKNGHMIGDHQGDIEAGKRFGMRTYLLQHKGAEKILEVKADFESTSFLDIAKHIVQ